MADGEDRRGYPEYPRRGRWYGDPELTEVHLLAYICRGDAVAEVHVIATRVEMEAAWSGELRSRGHIADHIYFTVATTCNLLGFAYHINGMPVNRRKQEA